MSSSIAEPTAVHTASDLPPTRDRKPLRPVSPPLSNISMHRFNYYLALAGALLMAFYAWRLVGAKAQAGGWWNLALGKRPPASSSSPSPSSPFDSGSGGYVGSGYGEGGESGGGKGREDLSVEERINELASALGMPSTDLAGAIADAVREYVPPASIKSIAAHQTGSAVQYIIDPSAASLSQSSLSQSSSQSSSSSAQSTGAVVAEGVVQAEKVAEKGFKAAAKAFEAAVGMEEPPSELA